MICKLPESAHWGGVPIQHMNACELRLILAYKLHELQLARDVMDDGQKKSIETSMADIHVPVIVRGQSHA